MSGAKILIVEDEGIEALDLQQRLASQGYTVTAIVSDGEEAILKVQETAPDLVLMDIMLQGEIDGITAAEQIRREFNIPVIFTTAYADEETLQRAKLTEPYGYIVKPYRERELYITITMSLYKYAMEKMIKEREKWFSTTLKSIGDAVIATDPLGRITFMNPVAEKLLGWNEEEALGEKLTDIFNIINMYTREPAENPVTKVLLEGCTVGLANHTILISKNGKETPIDDSAAPIKDDKGNILGVVLVFRDVTERMQAETALRESEERYRLLAQKLREDDYRKNEFMAVLSHELRNPLASIHISLAILERAIPGSEQSNKAVEIIKRQVGQLTHLVDDLLDITRITRNKIKLQLEKLELNELVRKTVEDHYPLFQTNNISLEAVYSPQMIFLNGDRSRLVQVVGNLLQNAAKFTLPGGKVRVSVESNLKQNRAFIRVVDNGIGMGPDLLPRLFIPFMQADNSLDRGRGGLGLGLALSKGLINLHGGEILAHSAGIGQGSEFIITLPVLENPTLNPHIPRCKTSNLKSRVLIVEDNPDIAQSLRELLVMDGHDVVVTYNGSEGIRLAEKHLPDVMLCDIGLPGINGYEVAKAIRSNNALKNILLVAMTGYALPEDQQQAADAGFDCHLAKPVNLTELYNILQKNQPQSTYS